MYNLQTPKPRSGPLIYFLVWCTLIFTTPKLHYTKMVIKNTYLNNSRKIQKYYAISDWLKPRGGNLAKLFRIIKVARAESRTKNTNS